MKPLHDATDREALLELAFATTTDAQVLIRVAADDRYLIEAVNRSYLETLAGLLPGQTLDPVGRERTEFLMSLGVTRELAESELTRYRDVIRSGETARYHLPLPTPGGERMLEVTLAPMIRDGVCTHLLYSTRDVTAREHTIRALRESEQRLREAQRVGRLGSLDLDLATDTVLLSEETLAIFGLPSHPTRRSLEEVVGLLHPEDRERVTKSLGDAAAGNAKHDLEHRMVRPDGGVVHVHALAELTRAADGTPLRLLGTVLDITARVRSDQARRASEERFHAVFEGATVGLLLTRGLEPLQVNDAYARLLGYTKEEILALGTRLQAAINLPEDEAVARALAREVSEGKRSGFLAEKRYRRKDGSEIWVHISATNIARGPGEVPDTLLQVVDITADVRAERVLREREERYALVERAVAEGIWDWNILTGAMYVSPRWKALLGYADDELPNELTSFVDRVHPDERARVIANMANHIDRHDSELRLQHKDGSYRWMRSRGETLRDEAGRAVRMVGSISDITDRKHSEQALRASEGRLAMVLENVTDGFFTLDRDWRYVDINPAGAQMVGRIPSQLIGRVYQEAFPDAVGTIWERTYREVMRSGKAARVEDHYAPLDRWFEASVFPFAGGISAFFRDITTRKRAERELSEAAARLEASLREKETLLREIHHRVKNNLQVIAGLLHFQSKKLRTPEDVVAFAELRQRIFAMTTLHERLYQSRDIARIDVGEYVRSLVTEQLRSSSATSARIEVVSEELHAPIEVAMPIGLIVNELVTNVLKYAFPEGREGVASVHIGTSRGRILLTVADDGVGFPPGFEAQTSGAFGWQLVRALVGQLEGTIEVSREPGARVEISLAQPAPHAET